MLRIIGGTVVALVLVLAGYLYLESEPHPTVTPAVQTVLGTVQPVAGVEKGTGPNVASTRADFVPPEWRPENVKVVVNAAAGPDGSNTAAKFVETGEPGRHRMETTLSGATPGAVHTLSLYVKPEERHLIAFEMRDVQAPAKYGVAKFDLAKKAVTGESGDVSDAGIQELPGGWFRCWAAMPYTADTVVFNFALLDEDALIYPGRSGSGLLIWGLQFEPGSRPGGYGAGGAAAGH